MTEDQRLRLRGIKTFKQLLEFLREELDWPIAEVDDDDDLVFEWSDDLGLKESERVGIKAIKQLRPLQTGQPWGIFFVDFEKKHLPIVILRRILNALVMKKRAGANRADRAAWKQHDLLFISAYGAEGDRELTFAHFSEPTGELADTKPTLRVLGWDDEDTNLKLDYVADMLHAKLAWPQDSNDLAKWRTQWSQAFELRPRQIIDTAQELAMRLAELAKRIRNRAMLVLPRESESGALRKLMKGFKTALIHDLTDESFADMYAQTITYGLFSAAVSRTVPGAGTVVVQEDVVAMVPITNPFLKEMLESFLKAGGRKGKLDFDELGIQEVVDLLRDPRTRLDLVLKDFGNRTRGEDPVIHFYEHFLSAYNKKLKVQRGVFYTPQPVVSYIVRSVHELLQTEFGLEDGLADITTWGEMLTKHPEMKLPPLTDEPGEKRTISPDEPFVQILDPATGTATFLVEVIDIIYKTLKAKWELQRLSDAKQQAAWNDYVPKHLLPRLHAFELMMAPYAIAHMKVGLKLAETGYRFGTEERARIYLTNALEPWMRQLPMIGFDALAHEAAAVNDIKRYKRFTVVIGNPPYSKLSGNMGEHAVSLIEQFRYVDGVRIFEKGALALELNLQDDYVKFWALLRDLLLTTSVGVGAYITNFRYLASPTLRGMRRNIQTLFHRTQIVNLGGQISERAAVVGADENVFDIEQGVAIGVGVRNERHSTMSTVEYGRCLGTREEKYVLLNEATSSSWPATTISIEPPFFRFSRGVDHEESQFLTWHDLDEVLPFNSGCIITSRDGLALDFDRSILLDKIDRFSKSPQGDRSIEKEIGFSSKAKWKVEDCKKSIRLDSDRAKKVHQVLYRPFDKRWIYYSTKLIDTPSKPVCDSVFNRNNLVLLTPKVKTSETFNHVLVSRVPAEKKSSSHDRATQMFPLFRYASGLIKGKKANIGSAFWSATLALLGSAATAENCFSYIYAALYSPEYRRRYGNSLRDSYPRIPIARDGELFRALAGLGDELTALHLLESPKLNKPITKFVGATREVARVGWTNEQGGTVWIDAGGTKNAITAGSSGFQGVSEAVWNFHIGGYQVCEKWLKDRKGRTLSKDDIAHYHKIVIALSETIRLMREIDEAIDAHGGWPGAFASATESDDVSTDQADAGEMPAAPPQPVLRKKAATLPDLFAPLPPASNDGQEPARRVADIEELDRNELCANIRQVFNDGANRTRDEAIAELTRTLGYQRTGKNIRESLDNALRTAVRRGILDNDASDGLSLRYRTVEQYVTDDRGALKDQFLASLEGRAWIEREDATTALARWLGFRRTGPKIAEAVASLINGLLREQRIESRGSEIRRIAN